MRRQSRGLEWQATLLYLRLGPERVSDVLEIVNKQLSAVAAEVDRTERNKWVPFARTIQSKVREWVSVWSWLCVSLPAVPARCVQLCELFVSCCIPIRDHACNALP